MTLPERRIRALPTAVFLPAAAHPAGVGSLEG